MRVIRARFPSIAMELALPVPARHAAEDLKHLSKFQLIELIVKLENFLESASESA